jgi:hypothetical protein
MHSIYSEHSCHKLACIVPRQTVLKQLNVLTQVVVADHASISPSVVPTSCILHSSEDKDKSVVLDVYLP